MYNFDIEVLAVTHEITSDMRLSANRHKYDISLLEQPVVVA